MSECENDAGFGLSFATVNMEKPEEILDMWLHQFFSMASFIPGYKWKSPSTKVFLFMYDLGWKSWKGRQLTFTIITFKGLPSCKFVSIYIPLNSSYEDSECTWSWCYSCLLAIYLALYSNISLLLFAYWLYLMSECENDTDFGLSFATVNMEKPEEILGMWLHQFFHCPVLFLVTGGKALPPKCSYP